MGQTNEFAHRMARKTIKLVDASGNPVKGKEVSLRQKNHRFLFGCGIFDTIEVANKSVPADRLAFLEDKLDKLINHNQRLDDYSLLTDPIATLNFCINLIHPLPQSTAHE